MIKEMSMKPDILNTVVTKAAAFLKKTASATSSSITAETFPLFLDPIKENLYNFIFKSLGFCEDADDIYQETLLRAFKYRKSFHGPGSFKTWIFTIAHNEIRRYFNRNKKKAAPLDPEVHLDTVDGNADSPTTQVQEIYRVAQQLTPRQRRVFFLFYDQQFSIAEINEITGLKQGNIKFILNQARQKIKRKLTAGGVKNGK
jgi:RNA polymerase sigma-70 factor, ECF subfamily